ncbi:PH domain [Carpediemonas membranifera]|uniref:PH domain n=1 Tax=Carpediemonas membranifera TaxID=201153 RepID=A0A8J6AQT5_9EUKA|nr:PH domain [Carpediemonas membranifera]|eukprot:KAG9391468.1 PH domain [Carpediemonas membranifera]
MGVGGSKPKNPSPYNRYYNPKPKKQRNMPRNESMQYNGLRAQPQVGPGAVKPRKQSKRQRNESIQFNELRAQAEVAVLGLRVHVLEVYRPCSDNEGDFFETTVSVAGQSAETGMEELKSLHAVWRSEMTFSCAFSVDRCYDINVNFVTTDTGTLEDYTLSLPVLFVVAHENYVMPAHWFAMTAVEDKSERMYIRLAIAAEVPLGSQLGQSPVMLGEFSERCANYQPTTLIENIVSKDNIQEVISEVLSRPDDKNHVIKLCNIVFTIERPETKVIKEGFFKKRGGIYRTWKTRYFALTAFSLRYYKTKDDLQAIRSLPLLMSTVEHTVTATDTSKKFILRFKSAYDREYVFSMANEEEAEEWHRAVQHQIEMVNEKSEFLRFKLEAGSTEDIGVPETIDMDSL